MSGVHPEQPCSMFAVVTSRNSSSYLGRSINILEEIISDGAGVS
jgi:hypothetical protein